MNELLKESFESYCDYMAKMPNGCQQISDYLREDRIMEAGQIIAQFTEGLIWLVDMNKLLLSNNTVEPLQEEQISEFLNEINSGLEIQDFVIVADMFEYEIKPFFEQQLEGLKN